MIELELVAKVKQINTNVRLEPVQRFRLYGSLSDFLHANGIAEFQVLEDGYVLPFVSSNIIVNTDERTKHYLVVGCGGPVEQTAVRLNNPNTKDANFLNDLPIGYYIRKAEFPSDQLRKDYIHVTDNTKVKGAELVEQTKAEVRGETRDDLIDRLISEIKQEAEIDDEKQLDIIRNKINTLWDEEEFFDYGDVITLRKLNHLKIALRHHDDKIQELTKQLESIKNSIDLVSNQDSNKNKDGKKM